MMVITSVSDLPVTEAEGTIPEVLVFLERLDWRAGATRSAGDSSAAGCVGVVCGSGGRWVRGSGRRRSSC